MRIYGLSGLGADKRVFEYLSLNCEFISIDWIEPLKNEKIEEYSSRLSQVIDQNSPYGIIGVSFGGLIATEISKKLNPEITILISTVETKDELRWIYKWIGRINLNKLIPAKLFDPPRKIAKFLFGAENTELLNKILDDTDLNFAKWAVGELINWRNEERLNNCVKIIGANDKLIPPWKVKNSILVKDSGHFMVVDKADVLSGVINEKLKICHKKIDKLQ